MPAVSFSNPLYFFAGSAITYCHAELLIRFTDVLEFFFVAHPLSGRKEGEEHNRIMYFYPKTDSLDRQTEVTGFAEAVVNFTDNFVNLNEKIESGEFPFRTVSTQKAHHVYIQVEDNEFLVGTSLSKLQCSAADYTIFLPAIRNVLSDAYKMFRLFFGEFTPFKNKNEIKFKERLEYFFSRYLPLLKLHQMPLLDYMDGAPFLRLQSPIYLNVVSLTSELLEEFPMINKLLFLYQEKVVYYSVSRQDLPSLVRYLTQNLLPMSIGPELEPTSRSTKQGRYLRGPSDLNIDAPLLGDDALPTVHLFTESEDRDTEEPQRYQMMVYRSLNATVCMFTSGEVSRRLMRNIDSYLGSELSKVASQIGDLVGSQDMKISNISDFHYIYFNPSSLSMTSSFTEDSDSAQKPPPPPPEVNRLVCESLKDFLPEDEEFGECFAKAESEWWIILKKVNSRLLCLLLPPSSNQQSLADVQARTQEIMKTHFEAIFFS